MELYYNSTRGGQTHLSASQAILSGLAGDGGLFVPSHIPALDKDIDDISRMSYKQTAFFVMKKFLTDFSDEELQSCIDLAYDDKFDTEAIAPLADVGGTFFLELYHGATIAFKDMALSILPHLMRVSAKKNNIDDEIVILTATSGDTGKAAMAGFADVPGTKIIVFYPHGGVSPIQEKQMVTQKGENTYVAAIRGNFDEAQSGVKAMFNDEALRERMQAAGFRFSSANSINIGRLVPQIVYYVYAYAKLYEAGKISRDEKINVTVPTGNFGNILAAYYAKRMGLPIDKLICASNKNKVLFDFFSTGTYDKNREFFLTSSPSMDILISSNLERLIYEIAGNDPEKTKELMNELSGTGRYLLTEPMRERLSDFCGGYATEEETAEAIRKTFNEFGYIIDTHTAVAAAVYEKFKAGTTDERKCVIASTASPFKFARSVMTAIDPANNALSDFQLIDKLAETGNLEIPDAIMQIRDASVRHKSVCGIDEMEDFVCGVLNI